MPMTEEMMQEEVMEPTDTPETEVDTPVENEEGQEEGSQEEDFSEADKAFLDRFEIQFDKNSKKFESMEQLKEAAEMGSALPRYKEKVSDYEKRLESPHYKWADEWMKANGYDDPSAFVKDIKINEEKNSLIQAGMSEEAAQAKAEEIINKTFGNKSEDKQTQQIDKFLQWHQGKVESGKFNDSIDAKNIPESVMQALKDGESMTEAFMDHYIDNLKVNTEQETIKKLNKNKETSTGELKPGATSETKMTTEQIESKINSMSGREKQQWIAKNMALIEKSGYFN